MSSPGFHLIVPSSAFWWTVGGEVLSAGQISPAFEQRRLVGDARSRLAGLQWGIECTLGPFSTTSPPAGCSPGTVVVLVCFPLSGLGGGGCRIPISSLCLGTAELWDHLSARINEACRLAIFIKGWFAVRHSYSVGCRPLVGVGVIWEDWLLLLTITYILTIYIHTYPYIIQNFTAEAAPVLG